MSFHLRDVVPWGRSYDEYVRMFALSEADLASKMLGCADGPASFNVEAFSLERLRTLSLEEIQARYQLFKAMSAFDEAA